MWNSTLLILETILLILEICKGATDNNKAFGALLTDFSKAFDCLSQDLLIANLHAYGLDINSLNIQQDYLSNHKERTKVDSFYSSWGAVLSGLPQHSMLGPLLLNIFMCDMFLMLKATSLTGYADDNTPFLVRDDDDDDDDDDELFVWYGLLTKGVQPYFQPGSLSEILTIANLRHAASRVNALEEIGENILNCISNTEMKLNTNKCHLLLNSQEPNTLKIVDLNINTL